MNDLYDVFEKRIENNGKPLSRDEIIQILKDLSVDDDYEATHALADYAIIKYINDKEIENAYNEVGKWYS